MVVTLQQRKDMAEHGNVSVILMLRHILGARFVFQKEYWLMLKKFIIRFLWQKVVHTTVVILSVCVSHATHEFMQREVTDGMGEEVIHTSDGNRGVFVMPRPGLNLYGEPRRGTVPPLRVKKLRF